MRAGGPFRAGRWPRAAAGPERRQVSVDWAEVYRTTAEDLVRFLHWKVWDRERARELAQEAFVRAITREPEDPRAWLFTVAANLARDEARAAGRRRRHLRLLEAEREDAAPARAPRRLERADRVARVRNALARLGERDREALLLWNSGLSYREIAGRTGLAPGAVGTTLARARKRFAQAYDAMEGDHAARG